MFRGNKIFEPPRYMSVNEAAQQLLEVIESRKEEGKDTGSHTTINQSICENASLASLSVLTADSLCVCLARVGADDQRIVVTSLRECATDAVDVGAPLHSLVIPGELHDMEKSFLRLYALNDDVRKLLLWRHPYVFTSPVNSRS